MILQPCSTAHLLTVLFGITLEQAYSKCGLALCEVCGQASQKPEYYPFCGEEHWKQVNAPVFVTLVCDQCGVSFPRHFSQITYKAAHSGQRYVVCSRYCQGKLVAARWGFGPNRPAPVRPRLTHCQRGHEFTEANTYWRTTKAGKPGRWCRQCQALRHARYRQKLVEASQP